MRRLLILSMCEVNRAQAMAWAEQRDMQGVWLYPHELLRATLPDAVLCDWDFWPDEERGMILDWLLRLDLRVPVVVKGYNVSEREAKALSHRGVEFHPTWNASFFEQVKVPLTNGRARKQIESEPFRSTEGRVARTGVKPEQLLCAMECEHTGLRHFAALEPFELEDETTAKV